MLQHLFFSNIPLRKYPLGAAGPVLDQGGGLRTKELTAGPARARPWWPARHLRAGSQNCRFPHGPKIVDVSRMYFKVDHAEIDHRERPISIQLI